MKTVPCVIAIFIFSVFTKVYGQLSVGAYYSTFNIPVAEFRANGLGLDIEYRTNKVSSCITASFFAKQLPTDSTENQDNYGNTYYTKYNSKYNILLLSYTAKGYIVGSNAATDKFSFYLGGGIGYARNLVSITYDPSANTGNQKEVLSTFTFDFLAGADYKIITNRHEVCKLFIQGKANFGLRFITEGYYDTDIPMMTNFQMGILFPLKKYKKSAEELY